MKYLFIPLLLLAACSPKNEDLSAKAKEEILKAEADMCEMAVNEGFHKALLQFADNDVIKPEDGALPIIGKAALQEAWGTGAGTKGISWKPLKWDASKSGDMGFTFGNWTFVTKDTTYYGNYYTIWKLQADSTWKFVLDAGNNTPKP